MVCLFAAMLIMIISDAFKKTIEVFGNVDILINNAGVCDDARWNREVDINLVSKFGDKVKIITINNDKKMNGFQ